MSQAKRISQLELGEIDVRLSEKDRQLLHTLRKLRYLKTNQIQRLFFSDDDRTFRASLTVCTRALNRLMEYGLVSHRPRQIGGVYHGSAGKLWHLTEAGIRLLDLGKETDGKRKRVLEPSPAFLRHTTAVSECYTQIKEICRMEPEMKLKQLDVEPQCWREYEKGSRNISLRPDLYAESIVGKYEDHWFIEMDLATEAIPEIIEKCRRYHEYYLTNKEQKAVGVFPIVLWIVPTEERKQKMIESIRLVYSQRYAHIFLVITPDELHRTLREGAKEGDLC